MVFSRYSKAAANRILTPPARLLLAARVSPDAVTLVGTVGLSASALWFIPRGQFVAGVLVMVLFVFSDTLDGTMARLSGRSSQWGAYLDSTLDRVSDAAVFGSFVLYYVNEGDSMMSAVALAALVGALLVSYARARAEGLGMSAAVGLAERTERLVLLLAAAFFFGLGVPYLLPGALWVLAFGTWVTFAQRVLHVRRQAAG
jgi:CDP-diacylglycerol--glycerol-3-phosphate 3-phosphatidyltransferase